MQHFKTLRFDAATTVTPPTPKTHASFDTLNFTGAPDTLIYFNGALGVNVFVVRTTVKKLVIREPGSLGRLSIDRDNTVTRLFYGTVSAAGSGLSARCKTRVYSNDNITDDSHFVFDANGFDEPDCELLTPLITDYTIKQTVKDTLALSGTMYFGALDVVGEQTISVNLVVQTCNFQTGRPILTGNSLKCAMLQVGDTSACTSRAHV